MIALCLAACLLPQAPGIARPAAGRYKRATAPRQLWSRGFPGAAKVEARSGWLLVSNGTQGICVVDPADGRKVVELSGYVVAEASETLLTAVGPAQGGTGAPWTLDAWALPSGVKQWSLPATESTRPGGVWNGFYYFGDAAGAHRLPLPPGDRQGEQIRQFPGNVPWPRVVGGRVYFHLDGHEICSLDANDLQRGWRAYCDCGVDYADADGVYGTATLGFGLVVLRPDGTSAWGGQDGLPKPRTPWPTRRAEAVRAYFRQFIRGELAVGSELLVAGGQEGAQLQRSDQIRVLGPHLYAFRKKTGKLLWKKPMVVAHPVLLPGKVLVWAGHRRVKTADYGLYGGSAGIGFDWRLEAYDANTGRRLWRGPVKHDAVPGLAASGDRYYVLEAGRVTGYR